MTVYCLSSMTKVYTIYVCLHCVVFQAKSGVSILCYPQKKLLRHFDSLIHFWGLDIRMAEHRPFHIRNLERSRPEDTREIHRNVGTISSTFGQQQRHALDLSRKRNASHTHTINRVIFMLWDLQSSHYIYTARAQVYRT